jgi:hypothetical protein
MITVAVASNFLPHYGCGWLKGEAKMLISSSVTALFHIGICAVRLTTIKFASCNKWICSWHLDMSVLTLLDLFYPFACSWIYVGVAWTILSFVLSMTCID